MSENPVTYKMPGVAKKMSGTALCHVVSYSAVKSKFNDEPQIEFNWASKKPGSAFKTWLSIARKKSVEQYLEAGIIEMVGMGEWRVIPLDRQPWVWVTLQDSKLKAFTPYVEQAESEE